MDQVNCDLFDAFIERYTSLTDYVPWFNMFQGPDGIFELLLKRDHLCEVSTLLICSVHLHVLSGQCECPYYLGEVKRALQRDHIADVQAIFIENYLLHYDPEPVESLDKLQVLLNKITNRSAQHSSDYSYVTHLMTTLAKFYGQLLTLTDEQYVGAYVQGLKFKATRTLISALQDTDDGSPTSSQMYAAACNLAYCQGGVVPSLQHSGQLTLTQHRLHPNTRDWLFRELQYHSNISSKCMLAIKSRPGFGMSCFLENACKRYRYQVIGKYFLSETSLDLNSILQSLAGDIARSNAAYLNIIDDNFTDSRILNTRNWKQNLQELILSPLQILYPGATLVSDQSDLNTTPTPRHNDTRSTVQKFYASDMMDNIICGGNLAMEEEYSPRKGRAGHTDKRSDVAGLLQDPKPDIDNNNNIEEHADSEVFLIIMDLCSASNSDLSKLNELLDLLVKQLPPQFKLVVGMDQQNSQYIVKDIDHASIFCKDHIEGQVNDLEVYIAATLSGIISTQCEQNGYVDEHIIQQCLEELILASSGRFDYAKEMMQDFYTIISGNQSQILSSQKKAIQQLAGSHRQHEMLASEFFSSFRYFRDRCGSRVNIKMKNTCVLDEIMMLFI